MSDELLDLSEYLQEIFDKFGIPNVTQNQDDFGWYIYNKGHFITICNIPNIVLCKKIYYSLYLIKDTITKRLNRNGNIWKIYIIEASERTIRILLLQT